jgi:hypothetical protein
MLGDVPLTLAGVQRAVVQADLKMLETGSLALGFLGTATANQIFEQTNGSLWVELDRAGSLQLKRRAGGTVTTLQTVAMSSFGFVAGQKIHLKLEYYTGPNRVNVYVDGVKRMADVSLPAAPTFQRVGFQGRRSASNLLFSSSSGSLDTFDVLLSTQAFNDGECNS